MHLATQARAFVRCFVTDHDALALQNFERIELSD
jgi:hypothetical protein